MVLTFQRRQNNRKRPQEEEKQQHSCAKQRAPCPNDGRQWNTLQKNYALLL